MTNKITVTPDYTRYYSEKSKDWAISDKIVDNTDYSSKYYANESKKQADISTAKTTEVVESGNNAVSNIENARDNAITAITNQENVSVDNVNAASATPISNVNKAGETQVANVNSAGTTQINLAKEQVTLATNQANIAKNQATIATNKTSEVVASGNKALSNIDTAKNNAITAINTEKTNAVNAIKTQQSTSVSAVQNQQTSSVNTVKSTGQSYVDKCKAWASSPNVVEGGLRSAKYYAEMAQGKSDVTYEILRASRAYEDKGALLTDEQGYAEVAKYKHSTFDKSKFTVVGSPTITDDGVASGFGSNTCVKIPNYIANKTNFKITGKWTCGNINETLIGFTGQDWGTGLRTCDGNMGLFSGLTTSSVYIGTGNVSVGQVYSFYISYENKILTIGISKDGLTYETKSATEQELQGFVNSSAFMYIGVNADFSGSLYMQGSIDLKHFSITVDGKEVFNGNKTGLDVIKPDNYEVVGSPVISDDGIASGFSDRNCLTTTQSLGNSIKVCSTFKTPLNNNVTNNSAVWYMHTSPTIELQVVNQKMFIINSAGLITAGIFDFDYDTWYDTIFEYNFTTGAYKLSYKKSADNNYIELTGTQSSWVNMSLSDIVIDIGAMNRYYYFTGGSIDLNAFKIYVDGNLVYQPCLKIPYTQSKTGSKIVDVAYRDRVIDLYEQEGRAGYYTIDEENKNFTLPMCEIYGMIGQRSLISSTVTETNRVDIYSDKTCLICGNVATAGTINLPIELANNNYFITLSTSEKTATSFTTTATGDYILIGKVI